MSDTGQAAGQQIELAVRLTQAGSALSYADAAAFEAAGWALSYRAAQADDALTGYTVEPHADTDLAALGWHLVVLTLANGQGPLLVVPPTTGSGWLANPQGYHLAAETTDLDGVRTAILSSVGVAVADNLITENSYEITEGDAFCREVQVYAAALTCWGYDADDIADGTLTLGGAVRTRENRTSAPNATLAVTVVSATAPADPTLRISWGAYPYGVDAMSLPTGADQAQYLWDLQARVTESFAITGVSTGSKVFGVSGDKTKYFAVGSTFAVSGSPGNDGTYTVASVALPFPSLTEITVEESIPDPLTGGDITFPLVITLARGTMTVVRQEDRRPL